MGKFSWRIVVANFSPIWFAAVMGTGGLANILVMLAQKMPVLMWGAQALLWFNALLFIVLLIPWGARWIWSRDRAVADLKNPLLSNFYSTMPAAAIIVGTNLLLIGPAFFAETILIRTGLILWLAGMLLAFLFSIAGMYNLFNTESVGPESVNMAWLMSPVVNIVVPLLGNLLVLRIAAGNPELALFINLIDTSFYGIGFMLFLVLSGFIFGRLIQHGWPPAMMAPSFWILLGPIGVGALALIGLSEASELSGLIGNVQILKYLATVLWGFGFWAFLLILAVTTRYLQKGGIPFSLSWWAFTFPLAAYAMSTLAVAGFWTSQVIFVYGLLLSALLLALWAIILFRTIAGAIKGALLVPAGNPSLSATAAGK